MRFFTFMKDRKGYITKQRLHEWLVQNAVSNHPSRTTRKKIPGEGLLFPLLLGSV